MDPSSIGGFTNLLNSSTSSPEFQGPQSGYNQQFPNFPPPQFDHDFRPPQYTPIQQPHYPHPFRPFGVQLGFQQFRGTSSYHGIPYHEGLMQFQQGSFRAGMAGDPSTPVGSGGLHGGIGGSGSRADESESPISVAQPSFGVPGWGRAEARAEPRPQCATHPRSISPRPGRRRPEARAPPRSGPAGRLAVSAAPSRTCPPDAGPPAAANAFPQPVEP